MPMKKIKLHCYTTGKSADVEYLSTSDMYKVYLYPGQETYLPWVEFCKDKDEAIEKPEGLNDGYYIKPTVFADVNNKMEIAKTEIFGPVLSVMPFENEDEAIEIGNRWVSSEGDYYVEEQKD